MDSSTKIWKDCCKQCSVDFAKKGTEEYYRVLEIFKERMNDIKMSELKEDNPALYKWNMCCKTLKLNPYDVCKGSENYIKVKELFLKSK